MFQIQHFPFLNIVNIQDDPYHQEIPLSYNPNGKSIIVKNDKEHLPIAIARIYFNENRQFAEIGDLYVRPDYRNNGMGRSILDTTLKLSQKFVNKVWLWTVDDNIPAIKLYEKFKFKKFDDQRLSEIIKKKNKWVGNKNVIFFYK